MARLPGTDELTVPPRTLELLVSRLQPAVVDVVCSPRGLDVPVTDPVIFDPADPAPPAPGSVVLAVGLEAEANRLDLVGRLGRAGASALVIKDDRALPPALMAAAEQAGLALLAVPSAMSWGQLFSLMLTAASAPAPERSDVPLGDLFALANAVAAMVGGAITIEDTHNRVLAYSNLGDPIDVPRQETILGRAVPTDWIERLRDAGVFKRLWHTNDVVHIDAFEASSGPALPRLAVAVRAGNQLLGSIWVIQSKATPAPEAERTLQEAADLAALHLLRHLSASDVDRRRRSEALLELLEGHSGAERHRATLGVEREQPIAVVAFEVRNRDEQDATVSAQRVADLVALYSESYRRQAACVRRAQRVYALVPLEEGRERPAATGLATTVVERCAEVLHADVAAGIGTTVHRLGDVVLSRQAADSVLEVLGRPGRPAVAALEDVQAQVVIDRLRALAASHPELCVGRLVAMAEEDATKGTFWVATLRAYLDAFGDVAAAAGAVFVHPNTFRYRLKRISEVFGLDLSDPDERLVAELQLRFLTDG
jgi:sugar diacid utilization regulator